MALASFIEPWPLHPIPAAAIGQLVAADVLAALMVFTAAKFYLALQEANNKGTHVSQEEMLWMAI